MSQWSSNLFIFEGSIPDERLTVILSFLVPSCGRDGARAWRAAVLDLVHASSVNHRWYRVANDPSIRWPLVEHHAHDAEVAAMIEQHHAHSGRSSSAAAAAAAALVRYPTQSVFELLAPKRIAATIFVAKSNMAASRWKRELGSHHYGSIARSCSSGSWIVSSDSMEMCIWQLMPNASAKRHTSSSVAAAQKLPNGAPSGRNARHGDQQRRYPCHRVRGESEARERSLVIILMTTMTMMMIDCWC